MKVEELAVYAQNTRSPAVLIGTLGRVPEIIATMKGGPADRIRALRLVECWNCHDELVAVLTALVALVPDPPMTSGSYDEPPEHATQADHHLGHALHDAREILAKAK